jgi:hypothetical protein
MSCCTSQFGQKPDQDSGWLRKPAIMQPLSLRGSLCLLTLKMEAVRSTETSLNLYRTTRLHIPESSVFLVTPSHSAIQLLHVNRVEYFDFSTRKPVLYEDACDRAHWRHWLQVPSSCIKFYFPRGITIFPFIRLYAAENYRRMDCYLILFVFYFSNSQ